MSAADPKYEGAKETADGIETRAKIPIVITAIKRGLQFTLFPLPLCLLVWELNIFSR
jgi:hypothetical protein